MASHVILNPEDHSIGHLPPEILTKIFRGLRGNILIRLTLVCKNFNHTIGTSKEFMDKIRLRVSPNHESRSFSELEKVITDSVRSYEHISLMNTQCDNQHCLDFMNKYNQWKSLKISTCHFRSLDTKVSFLRILSGSLEEIEFENVIIDQMNNFNMQLQPGLTVNFPKLAKLKCGALPGDFTCTTLKTMEVYATNQNRILSLLKLNPQLEDLTMTYEVLDTIFRKSLNELGINLSLKKLIVQRHHGSDPMDISSNRNFQAFLKTQKDSIEEVVIDWFSGPPPPRRASCDWFSERRRRRRRHEEREDPAIEQCFYGNPRRRFPDDDFNPVEDIAVQALGIIFQEFSSIKKLIVADKQGFLSESECPSVGALTIVPNPNITELRLRFEKAPMSDMLFEKLVSACPNVKSLFVHEMDQRLLECCARELHHLESIFSLSMKLESLPSDLVKFEKLQRINFCECIIKNHPEIHALKSMAQKKTVLKMIIEK